MGLIIRIIIVIAITLLFTKVKLNPQISSDYFFSSSDLVYQEYKTISNIFPPKESVILVVKSKVYSIQSSPYYRQIVKLTNKALALKGVENVYSLSHGPKDPIEANENLIWKEVIFGESNKPSPTSSTLITSVINKKINPNIIKDFEKLIKDNQSDSFEIKLTGTPYVVEMVKRYLYKDLKFLVLTTLSISAIMLLLLFRSLKILIGSFITSISAIFLLLILLQHFKLPFGILSPNLLIVIFLITQMHIIFLTSNYFHMHNVDAALKRTFSASLWSMIAIFWGFLGLSMVQAKPLAEFGFSGMIGTIIAISFAYLLYPVTLRFIHSKGNQKQISSKFTINKPRYLSCLIISGLCIFLGLGLFKFNTDPSIINYFTKSSEVRKGMIALDENGGSSTLRLILSHPYYGTLDNDQAYAAMHSLHTKLANHKDVGAVVSLPLLMKESKRDRWITKFLSWDKMLDILSGDSHQNIANRFMTRDRRHALFILRMKESEHNKSKAEIIKEIQEIVIKYGFKIDHQGGPYSLQARLAVLVNSSLKQSLLFLLISFSIVAVFVSRNLITSFALILSLGLFILGILGGVSFTGTAIDINSSPIIIVCLLLAIDIMIHVVVAIQESDLDEQFNPIIASILIATISFTTLYFSNFMPMKIFGLTMITSMVLAGLISIIVIPTITNLFKR